MFEVTCPVSVVKLLSQDLNQDLSDSKYKGLFIGHYCPPSFMLIYL